MLTPIWLTDTSLPRPGHSYADLHLHTIGSDGLLEIEAWVKEAPSSAVSMLAVTDHDHIDTIREWHAADPERGRYMIPGAEITARGRIVHIGVLFPDEVPTTLPKPGTPLLEIVRWARTVRGSIVVLVHPLPFLWRGQLRRMAEANLLPDAIETRFPFAGWRSRGIERAADHYGLAKLGGSDAHLMPSQLGQYVTQFPGDTRQDLIHAIQERTTRPIARPARAKVPAQVYGLQSIYSWLLPFNRLPGVKKARTRLLHRARAVIAEREAEVAPITQLAPPQKSIAATK